ncbi:pyridoxal phosphate-dependent aminotransferase [Latilactobacillus curvatus]
MRGNKLVNEMQNSFKELLIDYPSGQNINNLLAAEYLNLNAENVLVGNGAAELIKALIKNLTGKFGIIIPTFEEYANRLNENDIVRFSPGNKEFKYTADNVIDYFSKNKIDNLVLINPDNPSGNYLEKDDLEKLFIWAETEDIKLILDESFVDFADRDKYVTALDKKFLECYSNLIVVKSISKSYGIPGLRLGVLASSDKDLLGKIRSELSIWNINSFGEFFLQIIGRYKKDFNNAIDKFHVIREELKNKLNNISYLKVIDSQANYFMCEVMQGLKATDLSANLLNDKGLFIKDLTNKQGIDGEYVRIAIKRPSENERLISLLKQYEEEL